MTTPTLAESLTAATAAVNDAAAQYLAKEERVASRESAAVQAAGLTPSLTDITQIAQALSRGIFLGTFGGTANALTAGIPNGVIFPALLPGMRFTGFSTVTNSGGATVALGGIGSAGAAAVPIQLLRRAGGALQANDIPVGQPYDIIFDGSAFRFLGPTAQEVGVRKVDNRVTPGAGTWLCPPGVYNVLVEEWGAGGGGGGGNGSGQAGGGGAAGSYSAAFVAVVPGTTYNYTIGAGGPGGAVGAAAGSSGGTTSIVIGGRTLTAPGGAGGAGGASGALGGAPGISSGGDENITGSQGGNYFSTTIAGMGGSAPRGGGGSGSGNAGNQPGGGAGGGSVSQAGALGANGAIRFTY